MDGVSDKDRRELEAATGKAVNVIRGYALFLFVCGLVGFGLAGFSPKAKTSLIMGSACAVVMFLCSLLAKNDGVQRKIGIHLGMVLPLVFAGVFVWRAAKAFPVPAKLYLGVLLVVMALGSLLALAAMVKLKPKAAKKAN